VPKRNNLKEERFILVHSFRGFSSSGGAEQLMSMGAYKQAYKNACASALSISLA
jgi:hypothetical protein